MGQGFGPRNGRSTAGSRRRAVFGRHQRGEGLTCRAPQRREEILGDPWGQPRSRCLDYRAAAWLSVGRSRWENCPVSLSLAPAQAQYFVSAGENVGLVALGSEMSF